jgi:hypothetical protein
MDFCIRLDLPDPQGELRLETAATAAYGETLGHVRLPFDTAQIATLSRALDLNASSALSREFSLAEAQWLWTQGLITAAPAVPGPLVLTGAQVHRPQLRDYIRRKLYECLVSPLEKVLTAHFAYLRGQGADCVLHVRLEMPFDQVFLFQLPWELLHRDRSLGGEIQVSRYIRYPRALDPLPCSETLRVLVLQSEPIGLPHLALRDAAEIGRALQTASRRASFAIELVDTVSIRRLAEALRGQPNQPTIVHFAGHGNFGWRCGQCGALTAQVGSLCCRHCGHPWPPGGSPGGFLAFTHEDSGVSHWISADDLCDTLKLGQVRLAVINACKSALGRRGDDVFNGIAQRLMDTVPAVVATPFPLDNQGVHAFTRGLYAGLGSGMSLVEALHQVRLGLCADFPDEWFRPVLYLRSSQRDGGRLLAAAPTGPGEEPDARRDGGGPAVIPELCAYLVDFQEQERMLKDLIYCHRAPDDAGHRPALRQRPLIVVLPGWSDEVTAHYLLERLIYRFKDGLRHCDDNYKSLELDRLGAPRRLDCTGMEEAPQLEAKLLADISEQLFGAHPLPQDPQRRRDSVRGFAYTEPMMFYVHLELDTLKQIGPAAFLERFCDFWGRWGNQNHLLLVCVFVSYLKRPGTLRERALYLLRGGHSRIKRGCDEAFHGFQPSASGAIAFEVLPTFGPVGRQDATHWALSLRSQGILKTVSAHRQLQQQIDALFDHRRTRLIEGGLPIDELCQQLDAFLNPCQSSNPS